MATHAASMPVDVSFSPVGGAILIKSKALDERINRWSPASSGEMSLESTSGEGSYNGSGSSGSSHQSARSTPSARSPVSTGSERLSPLAGITRGGFVSNHDDSSLGTTAMAESGGGEMEVLPAILRGPSPRGLVDNEENIFLCSVATEMLKGVYQNVSPPQFLDALVDASEASGDCFTPVHFENVESTPLQQNSVRAGIAHCTRAADFLRDYGFSAALPPQPDSEIKDKTSSLASPLQKPQKKFSQRLNPF